MMLMLTQVICKIFKINVLTCQLRIVKSWLAGYFLAVNI